ncbi:MAG: LysM peptidoglycan-binding domain-containing protein [Sediminispirochaetaceae bacterium]
MKKTLCIVLILLISPLLFSQNLQDNPDYRESLRYKQLSEEAIEDGEYAKALEYAELSKEYAEKSDAYIAKRLAQYRANQLLNRAEGLRGQVERSGRAKQYPEDYAKAAGLIETARTLYQNEQYEKSSESSRSAIAIMEGFEPVRTGGSALPAAYVVRDMPGEEDCFWRIAGYDFIYGEYDGWYPIYQANKDKLPQPDNPDLIHPGMVMEIPEREGETRSGVWVDGEIRASAP